MANEHDISRSQANGIIDAYMSIRHELRNPNILALLSQKAKNYVNSEYISFAFDSQQIESKLDSVDGNVFRIYLAAKENGEPTIVIVPAEATASGAIYNKMGMVDEEADQHPEAKTPGKGLVFDIGIE